MAHTHPDPDQLTIGCDDCIAARGPRPGTPRLGPRVGADGLSDTQRLTAKRQRMLAQGIHPLRRTPTHPEKGTCGTCVHAVRTHWSARSYWKCDLVTPTHGPATDIRVGWPACTDHQQHQPEENTE